MPDKHAVLSASSCYRWLACPPSAKECARIPRDGFLYEKRTEAYPALGINGEKGLLDR